MGLAMDTVDGTVRALLAQAYAGTRHGPRLRPPSRPHNRKRGGFQRVAAGMGKHRKGIKARSSSIYPPEVHDAHHSLKSKDFYQRSIEDREGFWAERARAIHWHAPWSKVMDYSRPPFVSWFVGGETNLCYNAIDRHLITRGDQLALIYLS